MMSEAAVADTSVVRTKEQRFDMFLIWLVVLSVAPFVFEDAELYPSKIFVIVIIPYLLCKMMMKGVSLRDRAMMTILCVQSCYYITMYVLYYPTYSYAFASMSLLTIMVLALYSENYIGYDHLIKLTLYVITAIAIAAALGFVLALSGIIQPHVLFERNPGENVYNFWLTFTNISYSFGRHHIIRPAGYFMESGALAFYITHALLLNKISLKNEKIELLLMISMMFVMSLAGYISLALYFILFFEKKTRRRKYIVTAVVVFLVSFIAYVYSVRNEGWMGMMYHWIIGRFAPGGGVAMSGFADRKGIAEMSWQYFLKAPYFGHGMEYTLIHAPDSIATIIGPLVAYGIFGTGIIFMHVLYLIYTALRAAYQYSYFLPIKIAAILFLNYMQRPFVIHVFVYLIIIMLVHCIRHNEK